MTRILLLLALFAALALPACAGKKENPIQPAPTAAAVKPPQLPFLQKCLAAVTGLFPKKQKPPVALPPQWTGVIRMVNAPERFVLVEASSMDSVLPGENYLSISKGSETATLRMTSLKNPPFLIADIVSGSPAPGEKIYRPQPSALHLKPTPNPEAPAPASTTASQENTPKPKATPKPRATPKRSSGPTQH